MVLADAPTLAQDPRVVRQVEEERRERDARLTSAESAHREVLNVFLKLQREWSVYRSRLVDRRP